MDRPHPCSDKFPMVDEIPAPGSVLIGSAKFRGVAVNPIFDG